jgi:hypothetical protein
MADEQITYDVYFHPADGSQVTSHAYVGKWLAVGDRFKVEGYDFDLEVTGVPTDTANGDSRVVHAARYPAIVDFKPRRPGGQ